MKCDKISVSYGVTVSYAKYRFVKLEYSVSATLSEGEEVADMTKLLRETLRLKVAKDARTEVQVWRKLGAQVEAADGPSDFYLE